MKTPDEIDRLLRLDSHSPRRTDSVDVTADVLHTLRSRPSRTVSMQSWLIVAIAGWGLAIGLAAMVQQSLASLQDPLAAMMQ